jgi:hypothetical protein
LSPSPEPARELVAAPPASESAPALAPLAKVPERRVQVSLEDLPAGEGKREVLVVAAELKLRQSLVVYDEPGACVLDPAPFRPSRSPITSFKHQGMGRSGASLPAGLWMHCGVLEAVAVGLGVVPDGLQINDDLVLLPPGVVLDLPTGVPLPQGLKPCAAGAAKTPLLVGIEVERHEPPERLVVLSIPALKLRTPIATLHDAGNCTSVLSDRRGWFKHTCLSGVHWQHHSTYGIRVRPAEGKLLVSHSISSIDFSGDSFGAIALPCGARARFQGKTIRAAEKSVYGGCSLACYSAQGLCDDRCSQTFDDAAGEVSEATSTCSQACDKKAQTCLAPCHAAQYGAPARGARN